MKYKISLLTATMLLFISSYGVALEDKDYTDTIEMFRSYAVAMKFFNNSFGYAVFPIIGKAGYVFGGSYGEGRVYQNGRVTGMTSMIEGSIGFQLGGKVFSEIIFFEDERAYSEFTSGSFEFDATAQAIVITAGVGAQTGTSGSSAGVSAGPNTGIVAENDYHKGIATFIHPKGGLMYEFSLGGQRFTFSPIK